MIATFTKKTVYGKDLFYPANDTAVILCAIANSKTATVSLLKDIKRLGIAIELTQETLSI